MKWIKNQLLHKGHNKTRLLSLVWKWFPKKQTQRLRLLLGRFLWDIRNIIRTCLIIILIIDAKIQKLIPSLLTCPESKSMEGPLLWSETFPTNILKICYWNYSIKIIRKKLISFICPSIIKYFILNIFRTIVMLDMHSWTSFILNSLLSFTMNSIIKSGNFSTLRRSATFAMPEFKALINFLIILTLPRSFGKDKTEEQVFFDFLFLIHQVTKNQIEKQCN